MPTPAELVKSKTDLVDLINGYVKLTPAGTNWKARCPFHGEKTPSFMVSREKQVWHCFGCGRGGDAIAFVEEIEGMDFPEALRHLAGKAGIELPRSGPPVSSRRAKLLELLESAAAYYHRVLTESAEAETARSYLAGRGVSEESVATFRLGYAPARWDALTTAMGERKVPVELMVATGLAVKGERGAYDRFRGRILFPITDLSGAVVGFGGRLTPGVEAPGNKEAGKYINTPETEVFSKGRVLYGLTQGRRAVRSRDLAVVVEGNLDVIASHQAGIDHAVATCGTAFTVEHAALLRRFTENVALAFDNDEGGRTAARRALEVLFAAGMDARVIPITGGKDPADLAFASPVEWQKLVGEARTGMGYLFDTAVAAADLSRVEDKKRVAKELLPWIAKLPNPIEQEHFLQELSRRVQVPEETLKGMLPKHAAPGAAPEAAAPQAVNRREGVAERLLALLLFAPAEGRATVQSLPAETVPPGPLRTLYTALTLQYSAGTEQPPARVVDAITQSAPELKDRTNILLLIGERDFAGLDPVARQRELAALVRDLTVLTAKEALSALTARLTDAERRKDSAAVAELSAQFQRASREVHRLERTD